MVSFSLIGLFAASWVCLCVAAPTDSSKLEERAVGVNARYIFSTFTNADEQHLYIYTSNDAQTWTAFAPATYKPATGLVRDPSIIKHTDGKYYVCHTNAWSGNSFAIISSRDLKTWTPVATISNPKAMNVSLTWAPEWFKDPQTGKIHIVVSLQTDLLAPWIYTATDNTLSKFSSPVLIKGIKDQSPHIDMFPYYNAADKPTPYHAFIKNENTKFVEHIVATSVMGPWTYTQSGNFAGWGREEGPAVIQLPNGQWRLFLDNYGGAYRSTTSATDNPPWGPLTSMNNGLSQVVRHGTILRQF